MNKEFELINMLQKINSTMSHIKDKQDELRIKLDSCEKKLNIFIKDVNQLKLCMNDILCPLIKEISCQVIQKTRGMNKQTLSSLYDKLLSYMSTNVVPLNATEDPINHISHDNIFPTNSGNNSNEIK